jgi:hypothetical protein
LDLVGDPCRYIYSTPSEIIPISSIQTIITINQQMLIVMAPTAAH